ncbi:KEOPS complex subunit Pcc1 [Halobellus sp. EA9]|uniref:KEOPS complex subunit Pcc1 n=1 Tax=Halobellus sp. EA9 TaxID=3421647 RepID=UPI003EBC4D3B
MSNREAPERGAEHAAAVDFVYDDERRARTVAESVGVEVGEIADDRSRADVSREGAVVSVDVAAADLVALRAGLNTWVRLVDVAEGVAADADAAGGSTDETAGERS